MAEQRLNAEKWQERRAAVGTGGASSRNRERSLVSVKKDLQTIGSVLRSLHCTPAVPESLLTPSCVSIGASSYFAVFLSQIHILDHVFILFNSRRCDQLREIKLDICK